MEFPSILHNDLLPASDADKSDKLNLIKNLIMFSVCAGVSAPQVLAISARKMDEINMHREKQANQPPASRMLLLHLVERDWSRVRSVMESSLFWC